MWVEINKKCFENSDFKSLNHLFQILSWYPYNSIARYNIFIDKDKVKHTPHYQTLQSIEVSFEEFIDIEFDKYINDGASIKYKIDVDFNVEEAIRFFNQPISIILENNKNDAYFITALIYYFDNTGVLKEHLKNGWIKFENAGGCRNVKNFIEGFLSAFVDIALRSGRNTADYFRGLVILDSDKNYPNEPLKPDYTTLQIYLSSKKIDFHLLEKRAMENYMPDKVYKKLKNEINANRPAYNNWQKMIDWIDTFLSLSEPEKDYLKINGGFPQRKDNQGNKQPINGDIIQLYGFTQDNADAYRYKQDNKFKTLNEGFAYKGEDFKNEFPLLFINFGEVNKTSLSERAGNNGSELIEILTKIRSLL